MLSTKTKIVVLVLIVLLLSGGAVYYFKQKAAKKKAEEQKERDQPKEPAKVDKNKSTLALQQKADQATVKKQVEEANKLTPKA